MVISVFHFIIIYYVLNKLTDSNWIVCWNHSLWGRDMLLLILPEHLSSPPVFNGIRVTRSSVLCMCFVDRCLSLYIFSFGHCVSVLFRFTNSDYPFGIFKLSQMYQQKWGLLSSLERVELHVHAWNFTRLKIA